MAKQLLDLYAFVPGAANVGTITVPGTFTLEQFLLITNVTQGVVIYQFNKPSKGATLNVASGSTTLTLEFSTSAMNSGDALQIFADTGAGASARTVLSGSGAPGVGTGVDGDFYIDITSTRIYGPKASGAWGSGTSMVGTSGVANATAPIAYNSGTQTVGINAATTSAAGSMSGADKLKLDGIQAGAQVNVATDITYDAATREVRSSTGADATLPLISGASAGLAPASGGGTSNFLRADGTWTAPPGGAPGGSSGQLQWNSSGAFAGLSSSSIDGSGNVTLSARYIGSLNATASAPPWSLTGTWFTGGTATTTKPQVLIEPTGATSTAWSTSGTGLGVNAASGFTGNLLDLQVNGTSNLSVSNSGTVFARSGSATIVNPSTAPNGYTFNGSNGRTYIAQPASPGAGLFFWQDNGSNTIFYVSDTRLAIKSTASFGWSNSDSNFSFDLVLNRDAANTLAQRNGTNAQAFRVYNTYTSGTNYELGKLEWSSNVFRIGTEKGSGGGTARAVEVQTDSITRLALDTTGSVRVVTGLTVATLPGTPAVGMIARVTDATAPAVGSTVTGGGAAAALVWYNGANWRVIGV
jgi:hypothetical protein